MRYDKVIWSEGMFLQPQHFQQQDRYLEQLIDGSIRPLAAFGWGFVSIVLDEAAARDGKVALSSARGVMKDGTPFDLSSVDPAPEPIDIPVGAKDVLVVLALPRRGENIKDADLDGDDGASLTRYAVATYSVGDATTPESHADIQVGRRRFRLLLASDATNAYTSVGLVRIAERRPDRQLTFDLTYIPPSLSVRDEPTLSAFARDIAGLVHQRGEALARLIGQPGPGGVAEVSSFLWLQTVNRFEQLLAHFSYLEMLHPERLYATLASLAGDLSVFDTPRRRPGVLPRYNHDELSPSFRPLIDELRRVLAVAVETSAVSIKLLERPHNVRMAIVDDRELLQSASFVLAVAAQLPVELIRARIPTQIKLGPAELLRDLVNSALPGIVLRDLPVAPRQIPFHAGYSYFELQREGELWTKLQSSAALAMHIAGDFPGLRMELWAIRA